MVTKTKSLRTNEATAVHFYRGKVAPASFPCFLLGVEIAVVIGICIGGVAPASALEVSISTLDGSEVVGELEKIDAGVATLGNGQSVPVTEVRRIDFPRSSSRASGAETVFLSCGSKLAGNNVVLNDDEAIFFQLAIGGNAAFPIDADLIQ